MSTGTQPGGQLAQRRQVTGRQFDHPAHQVDAPDLFGDAVLDLQASVHFEEVEALRLAVIDELHGAGAAVVDRLGQLDRCRAECIGHAGGQVRRRSLFQHLLIAALHRAVAHAEGDHLALAVAEHLHLQVTGTLDVFFDEHAAVAEVVLPQAFDGVEGVAQLLGRTADAHADAATTGGAFQHHRVADLFASGQRRRHVLQQLAAFEHRYAVLAGQRAGGVLEAEHAQLLGRRSDEGDARRCAGFGKGGVLGEKAVAGVDRRGAAGPGDGENPVDHQVGLRRRPLTQGEGLVGLLDMQAGRVGFGVHGHAADLQFPQGAQDAAGDGATVGDQQFFEHGVTLEGHGGPSRRHWSCATVVRGGKSGWLVSLSHSWERAGERGG